jgi:excisionase family DNA binding protein
VSTSDQEAERIISEVSEQKKRDIEEVTRRRTELGRLPLSEVNQLRAFWEGERRRQRGLDDVAVHKRRDAEIWLIAIDKLMAEPGSIQHGIAYGEPCNTGAEIHGKTNQANMNADEAANYLRIPKSSLYKGTSAGLIPHRKMGRLLRFDQSDLDEYMTGKKVLSKEALDRRAEEILAGRERNRR